MLDKTEVTSVAISHFHKYRTSISNLEIFSWNSTFQRNLRSSNVIFATPLQVARSLQDSDHVFSLLVTRDRALL